MSKPTRSYPYNEDGNSGCEWVCPQYESETSSNIHPENALWAAVKAASPTLPGYFKGELRSEKAEKRQMDESEEGEVREEGEANMGKGCEHKHTFSMLGVEGRPQTSKLVKFESELDDWETDDELEVEAQGSTRALETSQHNAPELPPSDSLTGTAHGPFLASAPGDSVQLRAQSVTQQKQLKERLKLRQDRESDYRWKGRIQLISLCATSSETISALTSDIKRSHSLLDSRTFNDLSHTQRARLSRQHTALLAQLEDEKALDLETRSRLIRVPVPQPSSAADETARERVMKMRAERTNAMKNARVLQKEWERKERERERREEMERKEAQRKKAVSQERLLPAPAKRKKRRKKSQAKKKNGQQKSTANANHPYGSDPTKGTVSAKAPAQQEQPEQWEDEEDTEAEEGEVLEDKPAHKEVVEEKEEAEDGPEGELEQDVVKHQEEAIVDGDAGAEEQQQTDEQREQHKQHELVWSRVVQLSNRIAEMKTVLGEIHEMTKHRAVQQQMANVASQCQHGSSKRKRELDVDIDAEVDKNLQGQARVSAGSGGSFVPSSPRRELASTHEVHVARVEIEQCVRQVAEIHAQQNVDSSVDLTTGLVEDALNGLRTQRTSAAMKREKMLAKKRAEIHADVIKELAQVTTYKSGLDAQMREGDVTLAGLVLHVDSLEHIVEQAKARRNETCIRVAETKLKLNSYAALEDQNAAAVSSLRASLDTCADQADSAPLRLSTHPPAPFSATTPIYPTSLKIANFLAPSMAENARQLLHRTHSEITGMLEQNSRRMLRTFDARMQQTLDIAEELTRRTMSRHTEAHTQALAASLATEGFEYGSTRANHASQMCVPPGTSLGVSAITGPASHISSSMPVPDPRPPPQLFDYTLPLNDHQSDPSTTLLNITSTASLNIPYANFDPSPNMDIPLPKTDMTRTADQPSTTPQLDCSFLTDPDLRGAPIRLQHKDARSGIWWPLLFVKTIPPAVSYDTSVNDYCNKTRVEVQDCRDDSTHGAGIYQFPLDVLCYVPPTEKHQVVVCAAPGVDRAQQYYVLGFNEYNDCMVRKHPKVLNAKLIYFATNLLAQVAPPLIASTPTATSAQLVPSNAAFIPEACPDPSAPIWLKDLAFSGVPIHLYEHDGDGSILELCSVDAFTSTVIVLPLIGFAPQRRISLAQVRHVPPSAPRQMVIAIAGYSKGLIMKVETYGREECILYSPLRQHGQAKHLALERYKTAELAVISPSRSC